MIRRTAHAPSAIVARAEPDGGKPPAGRRQRKKQRQHEAIVAVAHDLFRRHGYENVSMGSIAAQADIAASTLYNYFPTKRGILLAISHEDVRRLLATADDELARLADDPVDVVADHIRRDWAEVVTPQEKHLWAHLVTASILSFGRGEDGGYQASRDGYTAYLAWLFGRLVERGRLAPHTDVRLLAQATYAISSDAFRTYVANEAETLDSVVARVCEQVGLLFAGWRAGR